MSVERYWPANPDEAPWMVKLECQQCHEPAWMDETEPFLQSDQPFTCDVCISQTLRREAARARQVEFFRDLLMEPYRRRA